MKTAVLLAISIFTFMIFSTNAYGQIDHNKKEYNLDSIDFWHAQFKEYDQQGDYTKGEKLLKKMFNYCFFNNDSTRASFVASNLAGHYSKVENFKSAMSYYNVAISLNQQDPNFYEFRGDLKKKLKDFRGSLIDYNKALVLSNELGKGVRWELYDAKGGVHIDLNQFTEAIESYSKAIEELNEKYQNPTVAGYFGKGLYYNRGIAYYKDRQKDKACVDWSKAGELGIVESYETIKEYCN